MEERITIGIVEDHTQLRKRIIEHFRFFDDLDVTISAGSGEEFLQRLHQLPSARVPRVMLMDIELPGMDGITTTFELKKQHPNTDVIMFTVFEDEERIFDSVKAGASGYLLKDETPDRLAQALRELSKGGAPMSAGIAAKVLALVRQTSRPESTETIEKPAYELSERECEILRLLVNGKRNAEIANELFLSPWTIKTHIKNIYRKMHAHSRADVTRKAIERNLI